MPKRNSKPAPVHVREPNPADYTWAEWQVVLCKSPEWGGVHHNWFVRKTHALLNGGYRTMIGVPTIGHVLHDPYTLYIGRYNKSHNLQASKWANPFKVAQYSDAAERYRQYFMDADHLVPSIHELTHQKLGCWCKAPGCRDKACHGETLRLAYFQFARQLFILYGPPQNRSDDIINIYPSMKKYWIEIDVSIQRRSPTSWLGWVSYENGVEWQKMEKSDPKYRDIKKYARWMPR